MFVYEYRVKKIMRSGFSLLQQLVVLYEKFLLSQLQIWLKTIDILFVRSQESRDEMTNLQPGLLHWCMRFSSWTKMVVWIVVQSVCTLLRFVFTNSAAGLRSNMHIYIYIYIHSFFFCFILVVLLYRKTVRLIGMILRWIKIITLTNYCNFRY